jgi:hypothetical protein
MAYTTINNGSSYFNTVLYTGNGTSQSITGVGFKPDYVWPKVRNDVNVHLNFDSVRGPLKEIYPTLTNAETTANGVSSFNTDGFSVSSDNGVNRNGYNFVAWNWLAANSTATNTNGSITSVVSANTTSGFSIVSFTGTGSNATVGHGLGITPSMFILKNRSVGPNDWYVYHTTLGATQSIFLDLTNTPSTGSSYWNNTSPTSSVFSIGTNSGLNGSGNSIIAYCFAAIKGYSKFGSYTGNGSADGTFIYTGFKPAFIMTKSYSGYTGYWTIFDSTRSPTNTGSTAALWPNAQDAEGTYPFDILSNGFKIRTTSATLNQSGAGYIYMAFASNPFVTSGGIPVTAR